MTKVLIVEDERLVARMYEKALGMEDFQVEIANGGKEGFDKAKQFMPNIILLDIMMPQMDGMSVLKKLKEDPQTQHIPVVMLTNLSGTHDAKLATSFGAHDYWVKSNTKIEKLGSMIKGVLNEQGKVPADQ